MRLWPDTLAGRTLLVLGGSILLLVLIAGKLLFEERREAFRAEREGYLLERVVTIFREADAVAPAQYTALAKRFSQDDFQVAIEPRPKVYRQRRGPPFVWKLRRGLQHALPQLDRHEIRAHAVHEDDEQEDDEHEEEHERHFGPPEVEYLLISLRLHNGQWLNLRDEHPHEPPPWAAATLGLLLTVLFLIVVAGIWMSRRLTQPMRQLAEASERLGSGHPVEPLAESGPREVRHTIRAFNRMQERLERNLRERSLMLAAVSHDLRTPITTLRLRAEYIEDEQMRERTLATLAHMEAILSDTLTFARDEGKDQHPRRFDLAALIQTLCDDQQDMGRPVEAELTERVIVEGRPAALQRAIGNLLNNALRYGDSARIALSESEGRITVRIEDDGPGIPQDLLEEVFTPFYRVEESRSSKTGGIGLGLAIARLLVHAQGGELVLSNRQPHGLLAEVRLPAGGTP